MEKKTTASARTKVDVTKRSKKKQHLNINDGSYLGESSTVGGGHVTLQGNARTSVPQSHESQANQQILTLLQNLKGSNDTLSHRIDRLERNSSVSSTPIAHTRTQDRVSDLPVNGYVGPTTLTALSQGNQVRADGMVDTSVNMVPGPSVEKLPRNAEGNQGGAHVTIQTMTIPSMEQIRRDAGISTAVSQLLAQYDMRTHSEMIQGKGTRKKSGRYNVMDTTPVSPKFRWPNEGFISTAMGKRPTYDDMSLAQWVSGQLNNMTQIEDTAVLRQVLNQVALAARDAVSIPWPAVRGAWALSMTQTEEGQLKWGAATQWTLNRINSSHQIINIVMT